MEFKEARKSSPEALRSSEDDLKIKKRKCSPNHMKTNENHRFTTSEGQLGAQICIDKKSCDEMLSLWKCHFEALELPEAPRDDQDSLKKLSKRPQVRIYRPCRRFRASRRDHESSGRGVEGGWGGLSRYEPDPPRAPCSKIFGYLDIILLL